jgi:hypothetical protein
MHSFVTSIREVQESRFVNTEVRRTQLFARDLRRLRSRSLPTVARERVDLRASSPLSETR